MTIQNYKIQKEAIFLFFQVSQTAELDLENFTKENYCTETLKQVFEIILKYKKRNKSELKEFLRGTKLKLKKIENRTEGITQNKRKRIRR